jgi:ribosomal-protein-alanine N-acetyltransferase
MASCGPKGVIPLELHRCTLRPFREGDEASIVRHGSDLRVSRWLRDGFPYPYTLDDARNWVACSSLWDPSRQFAIVVDGEAVGGIGLDMQGDVFRRSAEIGYWLGHEHWGHGILSEALPAFIRHAFEHFDVVRLFAGVFEGNEASARVLEKSGFVLEARLRSAVWKHGVLRDQLLYALVRIA